MGGVSTTPDIRDTSLQKTLTTIRDYARISIRLSELNFSNIGSLTQDNEGRIQVGPLITFEESASHPPWYSGPFRTLAERYLSSIDVKLRQILAGEGPKEYFDGNQTKQVDPVESYLILLELRTVITDSPDFNQEACTTYIKHGDLTGPNIMVNEAGIITGIIDWDW